MTKQLLTHSRMQAFRRCRRRHFWEYEIGYRRVTDGKALRIGSAVHAGLDRLKRGEPIDDAFRVVTEMYDRLERRVPIEEAESLLYEFHSVHAMLAGYDRHWYRPGESMRIVATERSFRLPLVNPAGRGTSTVWDLSGVIDGIVRLEDGRLAVLEHKTVSEPIDADAEYWRRLQLDAQVSLYVDAARRLGWPVETVLYDVIRKPAIRPDRVPLTDDAGRKIVLDADGNRVYNAARKKADREAGIAGPPRQTGDREKGYVLQTRPMTPLEWWEKLTEDMWARPEWYFARREIARLDSDIEEMRAECWEIQKSLRAAQRRRRWYKTVSRDTCPFCPYFGLCGSRYDPADGAPEGFIRTDRIHPELDIHPEPKKEAIPS